MNNLSCNSQGRGTTLPALSVAIFSTDTVSAFLHGTALSKEHFLDQEWLQSSWMSLGVLPGWVLLQDGEHRVTVNRNLGCRAGAPELG